MNEDIDLLFTRGLCRLAVPFFFVTSGFFLIRKYTENSYYLIQFEKKLCFLYFISILIYLPINLYSGYFNVFSLPAFLQDIFFDGTFYHLWYFPSCILGSLIAYYIVKKYDYRISFIITFISILSSFYFSFILNKIGQNQLIFSIFLVFLLLDLKLFYF